RRGVARRPHHDRPQLRPVADRAGSAVGRGRPPQGPVAGLRSDFQTMVEQHEFKPAVLWFTGLSGAGKSTIARAVDERLRRLKAPVEYLDGDALRDLLPATGFTRADRDAHVK